MAGGRDRLPVLGVALAAVALVASCGESGYHFDQWQGKELTRVTPDLTRLKDAHGRYIHLQGVNVSGATKVPFSINPLTYVGRPFPLEDADRQLGIIKAMGFNSIRLLFIWEAIEPEARGVYDQAFLDYFEAIIAKAHEHGIYVLINAHENLFSRFHNANYNEDPLFGTKGDLMGTLGSIFPYPYTSIDFVRDPRHKGRKKQRSFWTDQVKGDGAPRWAVKACMPEKNLDATSWGTFRALGHITPSVIDSLTKLLSGGGGGTGGLDDNTINDILISLSEAGKAGLLPKSVKDSTDSLPFTFWGANVAISLDIERCYASFFAGDKAFPGYVVKDDQWNPILDKSGNPYNVKEYLQEAYTNAWVEVAKRAKKYPNVIGYDIMNEPTSIFIVLTAAAAFFQGLSEEAVTDLVKSLVGEEMGGQIGSLIFGLEILPPLPRLPDKNDPTYDAVKAKRDGVIADWGFQYADLLALLGLNLNFGKSHLQPLYERVGAEILKADPNANVWIEESFSADMLLGSGGLGGQWADPMLVPGGIPRVIYSPHWYPDIYPYLGFNVAPRTFTRDEVRFKDYRPTLEAKFNNAAAQYSNVPTVFGEFGTYWNYGGIEKSIADDYVLSSEILDNFYEAFEGMFLSNMLWCYTPDNDYQYGDLWNKEDFSVLDPNHVPRGAKAYSRPHATFMPGKPVATHFYSDFHYFDPAKGEVNPLHEFYVEFGSKETDAPAEIYVPELQYPDGFYVWLSDGAAVAEYKSAPYGRNGKSGTLGYHTLYYYPSSDQPGRNHSVTIAQGLPGRENVGWSHYFAKDRALSGK